MSMICKLKMKKKPPGGFKNFIPFLNNFFSFFFAFGTLPGHTFVLVRTKNGPTAKIPGLVWQFLNFEVAVPSRHRKGNRKFRVNAKKPASDLLYQIHTRKRFPSSFEGRTPFPKIH